jgi:acyl carrier protein
VGGAGVSRGYLDRPALTAERFVPEPFSGRPGARLYRSGDLGRRLADGSLEYAGRADHQLKVRGFRIEPGEIQAALCAHPAVAEALVMARGDAPSDRRLVAYVATPEASPDAGELREFLLSRLPEHMVPQSFVALSSFPLTPHGKIDRAALPDPAQPHEAAPAKPHVAPRTETEQRLAAIWQRVLGVPRVSVTDNFFAVGGDSILATRAIACLREELGMDVPLRLLFEQPDIEHIARAVDELRAVPPADAPGKIRRAQRNAQRAVTDATGQVELEKTDGRRR